MANYCKGTGRGPFESATVRIGPSGKVHVYTGATAMGQSTKTMLSQVVAEQLGDDLRQHRLRALPHRRGARIHVHLAGRADADRGRLERPAARSLAVVRHADAETSGERRLGKSTIA